MALIAALGPALVAFVLDRRRAFPAAPADNRQAGKTAQDRAQANSIPAQRPDDLTFAPWPSISAAIVVFSPLLTSVLTEVVASIVKIPQS